MSLKIYSYALLFAVKIIKVLPLVRFRRIGRAIANLEYNYELNEASPEFCVHLLIYPNTRLYSKLSKKIRNCSINNRAWILEFIQQEGLFSLILSIEKQCNNYKKSGFFNSLLISKCLECVKELMNSKFGMESLISMALDDQKCVQILAKGNGK